MSRPKYRQLADFTREEIFRIVQEYLHSVLYKSNAEICKAYEISDGTFHNILYKAVSECIVEIGVAKEIAQKAYESALEKCPYKSLASSAISKYTPLLKNRENYFLPGEEAISIVSQYADSTVSKESFCQSHGITKALLGKSICWFVKYYQMLNPDVIDKLKQKALRTMSPEKVQKLFHEMAQN